MFSFFKGSSQTAESHVYLPRSYSFTTDSQLFSTFYRLFWQGNIRNRLKSFFDTLMPISQKMVENTLF